MWRSFLPPRARCAPPRARAIWRSSRLLYSLPPPLLPPLTIPRSTMPKADKERSTKGTKPSVAPPSGKDAKAAKAAAKPKAISYDALFEKKVKVWRAAQPRSTVTRAPTELRRWQ